ncbi:glycosyltransferase family 39 protein [candidate division WOR-3 bacterium]|nr:glycosyltransferase family 39 protein [candidate division WOR-3 bacterium]
MINLSQKKIILIILTCVIILSILTFRAEIFGGGDNAHYMTLAHSILNGQGYKLIRLPNPLPETIYPPLFPLSLSFIFLIFGAFNLFAAKILVLVFFWIFIFVFYKIVLKTSQINPLYYLIPISCNLLLLEYSHWVLSEIPYLLMATLAIYFLIQAQKNPNVRNLIFSIVLSAVAYYTRTVGISIILAGSIFLWFRNKKYALFYLTGAVLAILPWTFRGFLVKGRGMSYFEQLLLKNPYAPFMGYINIVDFIKRIFNNLFMYTTHIPGNAIFGIPRNLLGSILGFCAFALILFSIFKNIKNIRSPLFLIYTYVILYFGIILSWPTVWSDRRFLLGITPFLILLLLNSLSSLKEKFNTTAIFSGIIILTNFIFIVPYAKESIIHNNYFIKRRGEFAYPPAMRNYYSICKWVNTNIDEDITLVCRKPNLAYFFSHKKTIRYPFTNEPLEFQDFIEGLQEPYIILTSFYGSDKYYLLDNIVKCKKKTKVVCKTAPPEVYLLKLKTPED